MDKDLSIGMLLDFYGALLTEKQAECLDLYYNQDLSLSEIAQDLDITRQGVHDNIKRGEKQLLEYENALKLAEKFSRISGICDIVEKRLLQLESDGLLAQRKEYADDIRYHLTKIKDLI